jgi:cysteinyl-tRNA synthetase
MHRLGNLDPDVEPRVSTHLEDILALVQRLIDSEHAYVSDGDVYFSVESFPQYGKLSHRDLGQMKVGASERLDETQTSRKRHPADFALWKKSDDGAWGWESPWGRGRPGWHIECSAMSMKHLGDTLDLHGGGLDLVFPHHENEIAQSEAATGVPFSRCWMHNGFVEVDKEKMSKSLGNFFTARDLFDRVEPEAIRYFMMTVHYRAPLNLDWTLDDAGNVTGFPQFEEAERRVAYVYKTKQRLANLPEKRIVDGDGPLPKELAEFPGALRGALDDDLNMPVALAKLADFLKTVNELCDQAMRGSCGGARPGHPGPEHGPSSNSRSARQDAWPRCGVDRGTNRGAYRGPKSKGLRGGGPDSGRARSQGGRAARQCGRHRLDDHGLMILSGVLPGSRGIATFEVFLGDLNMSLACSICHPVIPWSIEL